MLFLLLLGAGGAVALLATLGAHGPVRPAAIEPPPRLVRVLATDARGDGAPGVSYPLFLDFRASAPAFAGLAAHFDRVAVELDDGSQGQRLTGSVVSGNYFEILGARAALGRTITAADEASDEKRVVVLSDRLWRSAFSADSRVIGSRVVLNGAQFTVIGIMTPGFRGASVYDAPDLWAPIAAVSELSPGAAELGPLRRRGLWWLSVVGRLAPGATIDDARAQLDAISGRVAPRAPGLELDPSPRVVALEPDGPRA